MRSLLCSFQKSVAGWGPWKPELTQKSSLVDPEMESFFLRGLEPEIHCWQHLAQCQAVSVLEKSLSEGAQDYQMQTSPGAWSFSPPWEEV